MILYRDFVRYRYNLSGFFTEERILDENCKPIGTFHGRRTRLFPFKSTAELVVGETTVLIETRKRDFAIHINGQSLEVAAEFPRAYPWFTSGRYQFKIGERSFTVLYPHVMGLPSMGSHGLIRIDMLIDGRHAQFVHFENHARDYERTPILTEEAMELIGEALLPAVTGILFWIASIRHRKGGG
jgi:hypothetical protein